MTDSKKTKLLNIVSSDRVAGSDSKFTVDMGAHGIDSRVKKIVLKSCYFTNSVYNIQASKNQCTLTVIFHPNIVVNTVLPEGQYTISSLITVLTPLLQASKDLAGVTGTITISYSSNTSSFTISNTLTNIISVSVLSLGGIMGYTINQTQISGLSQTALHAPDLIGLRIIYINIPTLASNHMVNSHGFISSTLMDIPCSAVYGSQAYYQGNDDLLNSIEYTHPLTNTRMLDIELLDQDNDPINFRGFPVSIILKIYY